MKKTASLLTLTLLTGLAAHGQTLSIVPGASSASINFDDTNSIAPPAGITNFTANNPAWTGATLSLGPLTDPNTSDLGQGDIFAAGGVGTYSLGFANVQVTQAIANTGFALMDFTFNIVYSITGGPLILPPQFPGFNVTGTVQPLGFAGVSGYIDYIGVNAAGILGVLDTVNYNQVFNTPPGFTGTVNGVPVFGGPLNGITGLPAGTTLTLNGNIRFKVDPASISASSFAAPEPGSALLLLGGSALLGLRRRR